MFFNYPYTDFHELNLDYIMRLARQALGLHLETEGNYLELVNQAGEKISKLEVTYAQTALRDTDGHNITSYILNAGTDGNTVVLSRGNGEDVIITVPYAIRASKDTNNVDLTSYIHNIQASGDQLLVTLGNGTTFTVTVPFAVKAEKDVNNKDLTTYVASITTGSDKLVVKDGEGVTLAEITVPYAVKALNDVDGDPIKGTYGVELTAGTTTVQMRNKTGSVISEITVPYATKAVTDVNGNTFMSDYGYNLGTSGNKITLDAHDGTTLNQITVPFATVSDHSNNGIESVSVSGDTLVFTTYGGQSISITAPYAVKALKDNLNNTLSTTYIANAVNDTQTGKITFYAQDGSVIAEMTPTVDKAVHDSYNNTIADYVKTIVTDPNSDYVTVTHGTGTVDTLTVHYSTKAWKDTYGNVIGNTYIRSLAILTDAVTGHDVLVAYNGELSELFRLDLSDITTNVSNKRLEISCNINDTDLDFSQDIPSAKFINGKYYDTATSSNLTVGEFVTEMSKGRMVYFRIGTISTGTTEVIYTPIVYSNTVGQTSVPRTPTVVNTANGNTYFGHYEFTFNGTPVISYVHDGTIKADSLNDLTDVTITSLQPRQILMSDSNGVFNNVNISALNYGYVSFGTLNVANVSMVAPIPLSVLEEFVSCNYHIYVVGGTDSAYIQPSMFLAEVTNSNTGITTTYSGLADAITLLKSDADNTLTFTMWLSVPGASGTFTTYKAIMTASHSDNTLTVSSVTQI